MVNISDNQLQTKTELTPTKTGQAGIIDPKIIAKALQKMRGLIRGNGLDENKVILFENPDDTSLTMYRFKARTTLKLAPQYGIRTEAGRNTHCELASSETEFRSLISRIAIDASKIPERRKQIIDFIFSKSNKGFGIKEQRIAFPQLNRSLVQHERCAPCGNTGHTTCATCHGSGQTLCTRCMGRRQIICPQCKGSAQIRNSNGKTVPCQFCRADGRISCTLCQARGNIKCQKCAASGFISCKICAGSGWMSHIANIEIFAQIQFSFDRLGLPPLLVRSLEKNPSRCVEKHDIEVSIAQSIISKNSFEDIGKDTKDTTHLQEPDDSIWIDYEAMCPFGPIAFELDGEKNSGYLFGFQSRLIDFPNFMDALTRRGFEALKNAKSSKKKMRSYLLKAAEFRMIRDMITQTLLIKNKAKTEFLLKEKYPTGVSAEVITQTVATTDAILRNTTRIWRNVGMICGSLIFCLILDYYFLLNGRSDIKSAGIPEIAMWGFDALHLPLGIGLSILGSKYAAKWSRDKIFKRIVPSEVLTKTLPTSGKTFHWSIITSITIYTIFLYLAALNSPEIPDWLSFISLQILSIVHAG